MNKPLQMLDNDTSPFHQGERTLQSRVGKREAIEDFARQAIRTYMPEQHRQFFNQLPFMVAGSVDETGQPWASLLTGKPGFVHSPEPTRLRINASPFLGDPLADNIRIDTPIGLIGIELSTRRRNRLNARVSHHDKDGFVVKVDHSFGNCPQYIQTREISFKQEDNASLPKREQSPQGIRELDNKAVKLIQNADTFFVSSYIPVQNNPEREGVDVSHRGGNPGFVKIDGNTLTIPDYSGNSLFNTLGNFLVNPKAGITFIDFTTGDLLMMTGRVEILWEKTEEIDAFQGAERAWKFTLEQGIWLPKVLPFRFSEPSPSPNTLMTGNWDKAEKILSTQKEERRWHPFRIAKITDENATIRSLYLEPHSKSAVLPFKAGQFATIKLPPTNNGQSIIRTYTVSSAPHSNYYRISVKRESGGLASAFIHEQLEVGEIIDLKFPSGNFFLHVDHQRPIVLIGAGIGITPMLSMAREAVNQKLRSRSGPNVTVFYVARDGESRAFHQELSDLEIESSGQLQYISLLTKPTTNDLKEKSFNLQGYLNNEKLQQFLALDDYDFYLCGPAGFMQSSYDLLKQLGVNDKRVFTESFGHSSIARAADNLREPSSEPEAESAVVQLTQSGVELMWNKEDGNLLAFAEKHGLTPEFSCRSGHCGACSVGLKSGKVVYKNKPSFTVAQDTILPCCAVPAKGSDKLILDM